MGDYLDFSSGIQDISTSSFGFGSSSALNLSGPVSGFLGLISKNHLTIGVLLIVALCLIVSIVAFLHWMWYGKARVVGIASAIVFALIFVQVLAMIFLQIRNW
mgnify:FL=1